MAITFHPLKVLEVIHETPKAFTIKFAPPEDADFSYLPGQYLTLRTTVNGQQERRAFSLSSSPRTDDFLSVTIKAIADGVVSNYLRENLKPGETLESMPPMGKFTLKPQADRRQHHIFIGGGSGITPLMSMIKSALQDEPNSPLTLLYANQNQEEIIFREELENLARQYKDRFHLVHVLAEPEAGWQGIKGLISGELANELCTEALQRVDEPATFYLCGPTGLMEAAGKVLREDLKISEDNIKREWYSAPVPGPEDTPTTVGAVTEAAELDEYEIKEQQVKITLDGDSFTVKVLPDQYILDAALDAGYDPPFACQEGVCCTCRAKLKSGLVAMDEREGLSDEELADGFVLTCQSHPLTDDVDLEYM